MTPAQLRVCALRWGIPRTTARVMAATLLQPRVAQRVFRRAVEANAGQLARLLVEFGGQPVPELPELEVEAERLRAWYPMQAVDGGWASPFDLAGVLWKQSERQRFFRAGLVARLGDGEVREALEDLGQRPLGSSGRQRVALVAAMAEREAPVEDALLDEVEELQSLRSRDVSAVRYVPGCGGQRFELDLTDGERIAIVPRELAEARGRQFAPPQVVATRMPVVERRAPSVRLPEQFGIGSLVTFATARAAEEALRCPEFRTMVARRLDERRVATRAGHTAQSAIDVLDGLGFGIDEEARGGTYASR